MLLLSGATAFALGCESGGFRPDPLAPATGQTVVAGLVRGQNGSGVASAVVVLERLSQGRTARVRSMLRHALFAETFFAVPAASAPDDLRATTTDAAGRYSFPGVSAGDYALTATAADHLAGTRGLRIPSGAAAAETTVVDIDLTPTGTFLGSATLENATNHQSTVVYVDGTSYVAVTNSAGAYSIAGVPVGSWTLKATHPGYLDQSILGSIASAGDSVAVAPMLLPLDSNLPPTAAADPPTNAIATLVAQFTGSGSDPDGMVVLYEWDFEDDGIFDTSDPNGATAGHVYPVAGPARAKLRVTDDKGAIALDVVSFVVEPPPGVYVSAATGTPGNPGTPDEPVATIEEGLSLAQGRGGPLYIAQGTYAESFAMASGIDLLGGYEPVGWTRDPSLHVTTVTLGSGGLRGIDVTNVTVEGLVIQGANAAVPGASSYGVFLSGASSVVLRDCVIEAGSGAAGSAGVNGLPGQAGGPGGPGYPGCENGTVFCSTCSEPPRGSQGTSASYNAQFFHGGRGGIPGLGPALGQQGEPGMGPLAGLGGAGGFCDRGGGSSCGNPSDCYNGAPGVPGASGAPGGNGSAGADFGSFGGSGYTPASGSAGGDGAPGGGGGGGGGGHGGDDSCDSYGGSGGGGGAGGTPGAGGAGGGGGGGSFAVWVQTSSAVTIEGCTLRTAGGGSGGAAGSGGSGGAGGPGGSASPYGGPDQEDAGCGGAGGGGGTGGPGGPGGGGGGGPSIGIVVAPGSGVTETGNTFDLGPGGAGGSSAGIPGAAGQRVDVRS